MRPDRQTLLFSATFKKKVEKLARDVLTDPVRIVQGDVGEANTDVTQNIVMFYNNPTGKWNWLLHNIVEYLSSGSLLIFVTKKVKRYSKITIIYYFLIHARKFGVCGSSHGASFIAECRRIGE